MTNAHRILRRVYWISAADHFTSGETEVHIHVPGNSKHRMGVPSFDMVNITGINWDDVKAELATVGMLRKAEGLIPDEQIKAFTSDTDALSPVVFEGHYRDLLMILSSHERRVPDILAFLRRDYNEQNMIIAVLIAACDVVCGNAGISDFPGLIEKQAVSQYGVPANYLGLKALAHEFTNMFALVPGPEWPRIHGPTWARKEAFAEGSTSVRARHARLPIVITDDFLVVMFWDHE